jgi:hypothetical protein
MDPDGNRFELWQTPAGMYGHQLSCILHPPRDTSRHGCSDVACGSFDRVRHVNVRLKPRLRWHAARLRAAFGGLRRRASVQLLRLRSPGTRPRRQR